MKILTGKLFAVYYSTMLIPFNKPFLTGQEFENIVVAHKKGHFSGDGYFTKQVHSKLESYFNVTRGLLTHSCTAALEMMALLINCKDGDEIIMPSYTFVSTANAFALRGAKPVFVDIRRDTLNIDENLIEAAITKKTKAIVVVHYAGVACEMDKICNLAKKYNLYLLEDAAQAIMSKYKNLPLGSIGDLGSFSFHETKNIMCGEGGALLINNQDFIRTAEIIREKGTDRSEFLRGSVDKYTWRNIGSSFLPSEITAAFLWAQFCQMDNLTQMRMSIWERYHSNLELLEVSDLITRPVIPSTCLHNSHMYYIVLDKKISRRKVLDFLVGLGIQAVSHYEPLHLSPGGLKYAKVSDDLPVTESIAPRIIRLPLWIGLTEEKVDMICKRLADGISQSKLDCH